MLKVKTKLRLMIALCSFMPLATAGLLLPMDDLEVAVRYEGGEDLGDFLPESQFGAVVSYGLFDNTALSLEYLYGEFENDDERNLLTAQLGIEF